MRSESSNLGVEGTYLEEIISWHRNRAQKDDRSRFEVRTQALATTRPVSLFDAIASDPGVSLIAECKRRSPSKGDLAQIEDPIALGQAYYGAGAAAISVLTDEKYFSGSLFDLKEIAASVPIPCLRKDFTLDEIDIYDARMHGASAVLLIVAALANNELEFFLELAAECDLDVITEVHTKAEIEVALAAKAKIIGINQRNLQDFSIDTSLACKLRSEIPPGVLCVAESGITQVSQAQELLEFGFDAMLVGEALVRSDSPQKLAKDFVSSGRQKGNLCL